MFLSQTFLKSSNLQEICLSGMLEATQFSRFIAFAIADLERLSISSNAHESAAIQLRIMETFLSIISKASTEEKYIVPVNRLLDSILTSVPGSYR